MVRGPGAGGKPDPVEGNKNGASWVEDEIEDITGESTRGGENRELERRLGREVPECFRNLFPTNFNEFH